MASRAGRHVVLGSVAGALLPLAAALLVGAVGALRAAAPAAALDARDVASWPVDPSGAAPFPGHDDVGLHEPTAATTPPARPGRGGLRRGDPDAPAAPAAPSGAPRTTARARPGRHRFVLPPCAPARRVDLARAPPAA